MIEPACASAIDGRLIHVRIGEIRTATTGFLKAILGSCVAIGILNRREGICGLAHCFLPVAPEDCASHGARYADRAVSNLLRKIAPNPASRGHLCVFLSGGGRLLGHPRGANLRIGSMNLDSARQTLNRHHIRFCEVEIGGETGCSALIDCDNFTFTCEKIDQMLAGDQESSWKQL